MSCSIKKKPVFLKVDDVKVISVTSDTVKLTASAFFKNPNDVGGKISTEGIKLFVDGEQVAAVSSDEFKVPVRKDFAIPLKVVFPTKKIFGNSNKGFLNGLIKSVLNNNLKVRFKGDLKYKVFGFSKVYPIDKTETIKIKL